VAFIDTSRLSVKEPRPGWRGRFFHSRNMTFAYYTVEAGAWIHEHSHANDEVWHVIDGQLEITIDGETEVAGPGCAAVVPPETAHSVKALTDVRAIVVDHPRRASIGGVAL
jgi:unsaturated pyranuronate lyase